MRYVVAEADLIVDGVGEQTFLPITLCWHAEAIEVEKLAPTEQNTRQTSTVWRMELVRT